MLDCIRIEAVGCYSDSSLCSSQASEKAIPSSLHALLRNFQRALYNKETAATSEAQSLMWLQICAEVFPEN